MQISPQNVVVELNGHPVHDLTRQVPIVKIEDPEEAAAYGLKSLPALVLFDNGIPERYPGFDLTKTAEIKQWIMDEILYDDIDVIEVGETFVETCWIDYSA